MSNTRSSGIPLLPLADPEALLRTAAAERRRKITALNANTSIHVPATSHPSTSFHTPNTSLPSTPPHRPFTPSLLLNAPMDDLTNAMNTPLPNDSDKQKVTDPPKATGSTGSKAGGSSSSKSNNKNAGADHYIELLAKLQHEAGLQQQEERRLLQEECRLNLAERQADRERIARLENTLFEVVTKSEEEKRERLSPAPKTDCLDLQKFRIADGPAYTGPSQAIEPFLKWINQLQIFFPTKNICHDDDKIYVAGGLIQNTNLLGFYASEGPSFIGKPWDSFKARLFEVALPQRWRTDLKSKLRKLSMGPTESFITFSGRARTLQTLINFDDAATTSPAPSHVSDFDLAEYVTLGINKELNAEIVKFALLEADPFSYPTFEKRVACFDEVTPRKTNQRAQRSSPTNHAPSNSPPDPVAWRVHAYLDSQGQCHHCKTACGSAAGACTKPLNKKWVEIPESFQTPRRPTDYKPPRAHGSSDPTAGKATHPPAGRPSFRSASLAAVTDSTNDSHTATDSQVVDVVDAIDEDDQVFIEAVAEDSAPPDLTPTDWATFKEIDDILADNVANVEEDDASLCDSTYGSDLGRDPFEDAISSP
ncbi:hypothetical protein Pst134EA_004901 [Puccinia striiformis f. sp. tritici]|nr:hypothetical protein Pst134EA_004901 [Puccinia striiformis f. sp. tritici]KAH9470991.1 hypothetical protein Pst134EA_004901 [Puccinia striiformis f. sp. tritici]